MLINVDLNYVQEYLPTKRYKKTKNRVEVKEISVSIKEIDTGDNFPVAFVVHDYFSVYEGNSYKAFRENMKNNNHFSYRLMNIEIRAHNGKLYKARRFSWGAAIGTGFYNTEEAIEELRHAAARVPGYYPEAHLHHFTDKSVIVSDNLKERQTELNDIASRFLFFDGKIWDECSEPMYVVMTYGLGHNHGGTSLSLTYHYNDNIGPDRYFNALQREQAIAYANTIAVRRGDTKDIGKFGKDVGIDVLMPEMVRRSPAVDHKDGGDDFEARLESIIENSDNVTSAGIGVLAAALLETRS